MISVTLYIALIIISIAIAIYALWDYKNRIYGNVVAAFLSSILFFLMGISGMIGEVCDVQVLQNGSHESVIMNATTNISISSIQYTYSEVVTPIYPIPVAWILIMCGVIMMAVTVLFSLEVAVNVMPQDRA